MSINLDITSKEPIYIQLSKLISGEIDSGRLKPNTAMPGTRALANKLGINRKTVVLSYEELVSEGWLSTQPRRGTFVSTSPPIQKSINQFRSPHQPDHAYSAILAGYASVDFNDEVQSYQSSNDRFSKAFRKTLTESTHTRAYLQQDTAGLADFRAHISNMLALESGFAIDYENICVIPNVQIATFAIARVLDKCTSTIALEQLIDPNIKASFLNSNLELVSISVDGSGMVVSELDDLCKTKEIGAVVISPHHQFPTGGSISADRSHQLESLSSKYGFTVIEYDHHGGFCSDSKYTNPFNKNTDHRRIYINELRKFLSHGLNIGYVVANTEFIKKLSEELKSIGSSVDIANQAALSKLIVDGELQKAKRKLTVELLERRDFLIELIDDHISPWVTYEIPNCGTGLWLWGHYINQPKFLEEVSANKVRIRTSIDFNFPESSQFGFRLSYHSLSKNDLESGIKKLKQILMNSTKYKD